MDAQKSLRIRHFHFLAVLLIWLLLASFLSAATAPLEKLDQCSLCKNRSSCLEKGIYPSIVQIKGDGNISLALSVDKSVEECYIVLTPLFPEARPIRLSTRQEVVGDWSLKKSSTFRHIGRVFLNYNYAGKNPNTASEEFKLNHPYRVDFAKNESAWFYAVHSVKTFTSAKVREIESGVFGVPRDKNFADCARVADFFRLEDAVRITCDHDAYASPSPCPNVLLTKTNLGDWTLHANSMAAENVTLSCSIEDHIDVVQHLRLKASVPTVQARSLGLPFLVAMTLAFTAVVAISILVRRTARVKSSRGSPGVHQAPATSGPQKLGPRLQVPCQPQPQPQPPPWRPRLASILSYLSSSSSSSSSSSHTHGGAGTDTSDLEDLSLLPLNYPDWMRDQLFDFRSLQFGSVLGQGQYGVVRKALVVDGNARWPVAVKCVKDVFKNDQGDLVQEGQVMASIPYHENIANLQGVAVEAAEMPGCDSRFYLMIEYCGNGSLHKYLLKHWFDLKEGLRRSRFYSGFHVEVEEKNDINQLVAWCQQIAQGMDFLTNKGIIHGDLATRNVLLTEDLTAKISDFGLAHQLKVQQQQQSANLPQAPLPERWMAPEAIVQRKVTKHSDIWSYGVLLWEVFSLGALPYNDVNLSSSTSFLDHLHLGHRLPRPDHCPDDLYQVMRRCWDVTAALRPEFGQLARQVGRYLDPSFRHRYDEASSEMYRRHESIMQNRLYFQMSGRVGGCGRGAVSETTTATSTVATYVLANDAEDAGYVRPKQ